MSDPFAEQEQPTFRQTRMVGEEKKEDVNPDLMQFRKRMEEAIRKISTKDDDLLKYYNKAKQQDTVTSLIMILGSKWTAKTELALTLKETIEYEENGYFLRGSFTNLGLVKPHSALFEAATAFVKQVIARGGPEVERVRKRITDSLEDDTGLLASVVPSFDGIVGESFRNKNKRRLARESKRFLPVLGNFLAAVASNDRPVVVFLENLDLADQVSLDALKQLILEHQAPGLIFLATSDSNVSSSSDLASRLRDMEERGGLVIRDIELKPLNHREVVSIVAETLECEPRDCESLCEFIRKETKITPLSLSFLLEHLWSSNIIYGTSMLGWSWDEKALRKVLKKDIVELEIQSQAHMLGPEIFSVLRTASCLGVSMDVAILDTLESSDTGSLIAEAASKKLFVQHERGEDEWGFWSEDARQALYETIPETERALKHWTLGRTIWKKAIAEDSVDENLFLILSQICKGVDAVTKEKEKNLAATLCLLGGQKAAKLSAFHVASVFLQTGLSFLNDSSWIDDYDLMHSLQTSVAEMALCEGSFEVAEKHIDAVLRHSRCLDDMIPAYCTRIMVLSATERIGTAVDTCIDVLGKIGESLHPKPGRFSIAREFAKVRRLLRKESDEQLLRIPKITNLQKLNAMRILNLLHINTMQGNVEINALVCLRMVQITILYGHSVLSSVAFSAYAMLQLSTGKLEEGYRFAELSLSIQKLHGAIEYMPRVMLSCYGFVFSWTKPFEQCLQPLLDAQKLSLQTGDVEMACVASNLYCCLSFESGKRLDVLLQEWTTFQKVMSANGQMNWLRMSMAPVQIIRHLMGLTDDPLNPKGDVYDFDETAALTKKAGAIKAHVSLRIWQMRVAYYFKDYKLASKCALLREFKSMPTAFMLHGVLFFGALVCLQAVRDGREVRDNLKMVKSITSSFRRWSLVTPENFCGPKMLIEAELASIKKQNDTAYEKFICAIGLTHGNFSYHALANELLAQHLLRIGETERALPFFRKSIAAYYNWGGKAKAERLEREVDELSLTIGPGMA